MTLKIYIVCLVGLIFYACSPNSNHIKNKRQGKQKVTVALIENDEKKFFLDDNTAPRPEYTALYNSLDNKMYFTFLNNYKNGIFFYDYKKCSFEKEISWPKEGPNNIRGIKGYFIKNPDSIYLFSKATMEIVLTSENGKIINKTALWGDLKDNNCGFRFPQYFMQTVAPFIETPNELLLTGFFFGRIPDSIISNFKITARLNFKTNKVNFSHPYPQTLYGNNYNWGCEYFTEVYSTLNPEGSQLILSYPVSHELYLFDLKTGHSKTIYAGSNYANTIHSLDKAPKEVSSAERAYHFVSNDAYAAILYDKFRKLYYRFLLKAVPDANINTNYKEKPVNIIVMDEKFNYLGETTIGKWKNWNWSNSFITEEGLNIEYTGDEIDENNLILKIFTIKKI